MNREAQAYAHAPFPPPPHDPRDRVLVGTSGEWEIRTFAKTDRKYAWFAARGLFHAQLWHPKGRISILTASGLTAGRYEAFPIEGWKFADADLENVLRRVFGEHGVEVPSQRAVMRIESWFVTRDVRLATRQDAMEEPRRVPGRNEVKTPRKETKR